MSELQEMDPAPVTDRSPVHPGPDAQPRPSRTEGPRGAVDILRRGIAASPELKRGIGWTVLLALLGGGGRVVVPVLVQQVLDRGLVAGDVDLATVYQLALLGVVAVAGTAIVTRVAQKRLAMASEHALCGLRVKAFSHAHRLSVADQSEAKRGALVSRVTSDVETLGVFLQWGGVAWVVNGAIMLVTLCTMAVYDVRLTLVTIVVILPLVLLLRGLQQRLGAAHDQVRSRVGELLTVVSETVQGAGVVRAYGIEARTNERSFRAIGRWRDAKIRAGLLGALVFTSGEFFATLTVVGVITAGVVLGPLSGLTVGQLVAFILLVNLFLEPVTELTEVIDQTQTAVAGWRKVLDLLGIPIEVRAPEHGASLPAGPPPVVVERLCYAYRAGDGLVLDDMSFSIGAGSRIALVGATGSGKTTLAKLLVRLADPTRGRILVNGIDLRDVTADALRCRLLLVPQDCFLFNASLGDNVAFTRPSATRGELLRAFEDLGLRDWVDGLPTGLDTPVGQRGKNLSMGERQFVALTRAYLANPACLILDEATASVDPATETRLTRALETLSAGRTLITVAHRLATAERADEILVLDHGRLVEQGTHHQLIASDGIYAHLHASWLDVTAEAAAG